MTHHTWWLASRAAGIVALLLVSASVLIGLAMASGLLRKPGIKRALLPFHEHTALAGLVAIGVHGVTLLGDPWLHPSLAGISVPFAIAYRSFYTGLGIIAGWLAALLGLSFYLRKHIGAKFWRKAHRATFAVWVLGLLHTIGAGTDASAGWLREFMIVTAVAMTVLLARRLIGAWLDRRDRVVLRRPVARGRLVETEALDQVRT
jgi:methionine sulfoxide reductase heme-binding subunit